MACYRCMFSSIIWQVLRNLPVEQEHTIHPMASMCAHSALQFLGNGAHPLTLLGLPADPEPAALCPPASWAASWVFFIKKREKYCVYVFCYRKDWTSTLQYGTQKLCMYGNGEDDLSYWTCVQFQLLYVAIKICSNQIKSNQKSYFLNRNIWGSPCCPERGSWGRTGTGRQDTHCCFRQWIHWTRCV